MCTLDQLMGLFLRPKYIICEEKLISVMLNNSEEVQANLNRTLEAICR